MESHNTLLKFAEKYRIRVKFDECHDSIVPGKFGHLYEHGTGLIGMVLEDKRNGPSTARFLVARRRKALAAGFQLHQAGDAEAILLFELGNGEFGLANAILCPPCPTSARQTDTSLKPGYIG